MSKNFRKVLSGLFIGIYILSAQSALGFFSLQQEPPTPSNSINTTIAPGESKTFKAKVRNTIKDPVRLNIYGVDGTTTIKGRYSLSSKSTPQRTMGKWININGDSKITIQPRETYEFEYQISVPANATPGDYFGGIIAEAIEILNSEEKAKKDAAINSGFGAASVARIGSKIFVEVPGKRTTKLDIPKFTHYESKGFHNFDIEFTNSGNTILRVRPEIAVSPEMEPLGTEAVVFPNDSTSITLRYPKKDIFKPINSNTFLGDLLRIQSPLFGNFTPKLTVEYSTYDIIKNEYSNPQIITKETQFTVFPWKIIILVIAIVLLALLYNLFTTIQHKRLIARCERYTIKEGDTIISIAKERNIKWKNLAKLNNLLPPYSLTPGQEIIAPKIKSQQ